MNNSDLLKEAQKHFMALNESGSDIKEVKEIAPGIIVAFDALDNTFLYYFLTDLFKFKKDHIAQLWGANDQRGRPEGCSNDILGFVCGINRPTNWDQVIEEARKRLIGINNNDIVWFPEPRELTIL